MSTSIDTLVDKLPEGGLTVRSLQLLDKFAPGQWQNTIGFDNTIRLVTGESDPQMISTIRARALTLYADNSQGYQRAISIYQLTDTADYALGAAALANKIGEKIGFLSFLSKLTPSHEKAQATDLAMKLIAELVAFCNTNGFPGDSIGDFMGAVGAYERENLIRMMAIITFNGLIPLGPDYAGKLMDTVRNLNVQDIENNPFFSRAKHLIPGGGSAAEALSFIGRGMGDMEGYVSGFTSKYGITLDGVLNDIRGWIDFTDDKLDYLAAFLAMSTDFMTHTGIQSVSRSLIDRAVSEI